MFRPDLKWTSLRQNNVLQSQRDQRDTWLLPKKWNHRFLRSKVRKGSPTMCIDYKFFFLFLFPILHTFPSHNSLKCQTQSFHVYAAVFLLYVWIVLHEVVRLNTFLFLCSDFAQVKYTEKSESSFCTLSCLMSPNRH